MSNYTLTEGKAPVTGPTPVFANSVSYFINDTDLILDFGFALQNPSPAPGIIHTRVVMGVSVLDPLVKALQSLAEGRQKAIAAVAKKPEDS
jgi:hypothetical protein